jgi:hypothetical protein
VLCHDPENNCHLIGNNINDKELKGKSGFEVKTNATGDCIERETYQKIVTTLHAEVAWTHYTS